MTDPNPPEWLPNTGVLLIDHLVGILERARDLEPVEWKGTGHA